jgi:L-alanine-DL-glutamate epimerase-like enolase superfamily enzyme
MTNTTRRTFLKTSAGAACAASGARHVSALQGSGPDKAALDRILAEPVLRRDLLKAPIKLERLELLRNGEQFLIRARSSDGAESITVPNNSRLRDVYPMFLLNVVPFFIGKDVRDMESLLWEVYRHQSNYKFQGLSFWVCVATVEMALLDLMGQISGKAIGDLLGGVRRRDIAVYRASGNRGNTPEAEIDYLKGVVAETGAKAIKFRLGGRMSRNADSLQGRTEALIPLVRKTFGDEFTLYGDSNSSYDVPNALRIGRLMEEHRYAMLEEPCEFDDLWATKKVADTLKIPIGLGEQEFSMRRFQWTIENRVADIIQPDLHYFGGYIRCTKVARMAAAAGMPCTLHLSEFGFAYLNILHFASYVADPGPFQEFKGETGIPFACDTSPLTCKNGNVRCPSGPGFGVTVDPDYVRRFQPVKDV